MNANRRINPPATRRKGVALVWDEILGQRLPKRSKLGRERQEQYYRGPAANPGTNIDAPEPVRVPWQFRAVELAEGRFLNH